MAAYLELNGIIATAEGNQLRKKMLVATVIGAQGLLAGTPTAEQKAWALGVLADPEMEASKLLRYLIASNSALTTTQITGVTDAALQAAVTAALPKVI